MVIRKKTYNEIMNKLDKLEKDLASVSSTVSNNQRGANERFVEVAKKIEELAETISNMTDDNKALTARKILIQYLYGEQEDDKK